MALRRSKRTDGRYCVNLTVEESDGLKKRTYFYGRTQTEAKRKAEDARERMAAGGPVRDASRTVTDWLEEWRGTFLQSSDRATATKDLYAGLTRRHVEPVIGRSPLGQVRPSDVTRVLLTMERASSAASTRRNTYAAMRAAFDDAVADGLLTVNPVSRVRRPKAASAEAVSLTVAEAQAFLAGAQGLRYAGALRLILGTGLRRGEALALRWDDVRLDRGEATIRGSLVRRDGRLVVADTKSLRSRRTVSLSPAVVQFLTLHRARQVEERQTAANLWVDTGFVFVTEFGHPADPRNLLRATTIASRNAGLTSVGVHTLRHTYATIALLHGVPIHVVSRNLGHSSIALVSPVPKDGGRGHLQLDAGMRGTYEGQHDEQGSVERLRPHGGVGVGAVKAGGTRGVEELSDLTHEQPLVLSPLGVGGR